MKLNLREITGSNRNEWIEKGYRLPEYDIEEIRKNTLERPRWIHFGGGNIFRAFPAVALQKMLNNGEVDTGLIAVEGFDYEIVDMIYRPHDNLSLVVTLNSDGSIDKEVIASVSDSIAMDPSRKEEYDKLRHIFVADSLQFASFTITEKGYSLTDSKGEYYPQVEEDFRNEPSKSITYMGQIAALCYERYRKSSAPLALVSMDNFSHNGEKLKNAIITFAEKWVEAGLVEEGFREYVNDENKVTFPWSMIDKITPRPDAGVAEMLEADGFEDTTSVITVKNTFIAPFVNAERAEYLVIEDNFPGGRLELEKGGVFFTSQEIVDKCDRMKVCSCLNPLHTALAVMGCLLGFDKISKEMEDEDLRKLVFDMGYGECLPVVVDPGIINPDEFIKTVLEERIPNPFMPDTPQRIACDTSQKIPIRFGETIKRYEEDSEKKLESLKLIPLVLAAWCRYLMGKDDNWEEFTPSPDPLYDEMSSIMKAISPGDTEDAKIEEPLRKILSVEKVFGIDLSVSVLFPVIKEYFASMNEKAGGIRETLHNAVK